METLFAVLNPFDSVYYLKDALNNHINSGKLEDLVSWAKESGYRVQIRERGNIRWA